MPNAPVLFHRIVKRSRAAEHLVEGADTSFGIVKCVHDALSGNRIFVISRIADEYPAGAIRLSEKIRRWCSGKWSDTFCALNSFRKFRCEREDREVTSFDVSLD